MEITSVNRTENGTFEKTEDLLRNNVSPQTAMTSQIINGSLQNQTEQNNALRLSVNEEAGMGLMIDTRV